MNIQRNTRVFICPTDTVYGISSRYDDEEAVNRIRKMKGREDDKRFVTLISSFEHLKNFEITLTKRQKEFLQKIWPGPVTVVFETESDSVAIRMPKHKGLLNLIDHIGPIISTSANLANQKTVTGIQEARELFQDAVDEYIDGGILEGEPSVIVKIIR